LIIFEAPARFGLQGFLLNREFSQDGISRSALQSLGAPHISRRGDRTPAERLEIVLPAPIAPRLISAFSTGRRRLDIGTKMPDSTVAQWALKPSFPRL